MALPEGGKNAKEAEVSNVHVPGHIHYSNCVDQYLLRGNLRHTGNKVSASSWLRQLRHM